MFRSSSGIDGIGIQHRTDNFMNEKQDLNPITLAFAVFLGIAVPAMIFGKTGIAVASILALALSAFHPGRAAAWPPVKTCLSTRVSLLAGLTALMWLVGVVHSLDPLRSFEAWARIVIIALAAVYFATLLTQRHKYVDLCFRVLLATTAFACVIGFIGLAVPEVLGFIHAKGWSPQSSDVGLKQFASAAMLLVPVAIWAVVRFNGFWRALAISDAAALFAIILATSSRASMSGLFAMLLVVGLVAALQFGSRRFTISFLALLGFSALTLFAWIYTRHQAPWAQEMDMVLPVWLVDAPRQEIWAFTWEKAMESPWIGHGINVVNFLPGADEHIVGMGRHTFISGHPHNWLLEIFSETGIVGLFPLLALIGAVLFTLIRAFRSSQNSALLAAMAIHVGYWVSGLSNFSVWSAWWQVSALFLLALTWRVGLMPERAKKTPRS